MMDKSKLMERLLATFLDELDEHVRAINDELMALEKNPADDQDGERLTRLFRAAHSLKGASRAVDQPGIEQICHRMEDVFTGFRDGRLQPTPNVCAVLFDVADAIESAGMRLREKVSVDNAQLSAQMPKLDAVANGEIPEPQSQMRRPTDDPPAKQTDTDPAETIERTPTETIGRTPTETIETTSPAPAKSLPTTIRVAEEKLDSLLAQSGELLVARQRVDGRPGDLDPVVDFVSQWRTEWRNIEGTLRRIVQDDAADPLLRRSPRLRDRVTEAVEQNGERLKRVEKLLETFAAELRGDARQLKLATTALQDDIHRIRMLPFAEACAGLERAVRDVCRATEKQVELIVEGGDIEVDRSVLEGLSDPLLHLVRNAVDHGIEPPAEREAAGKRPSGTVHISAAIRGAEVDIIVADDGRGLNLDVIRERILSRGMPEPANDQELARCIFLPGFSTTQIVTDVSGRGVGMDVVKSRIESLHGRIDIASERGLGTRFTLSVPLTLTTVSALFVRCQDQTYAFPTNTVQRLVRFDESELKRQQGQTVLPLGDVPVRVVALADVLELAPRSEAANKRVGVLTRIDAKQTLFVVDAVLAEQEAVVKTLGARIRHVPHVSGAITQRSGLLALLLNTANLTRSAEAATPGSFSPLIDGGSTESSRPDKTAARRVLVVDDSMTTRALLKSILEAAGYDVRAATDGQDAWERLQADEVDVVVSDVDMPRMGGFELTERIRQSPNRGQLPVILVTSRESDADKRRGVEVGADAYLVKSSFDQSIILETVEQFV